jgi:hypothetical protein
MNQEFSEESPDQEFTSDEELLTDEDILNKIKKDLYIGKTVVIGFSERFYNNYLVDLKNILRSYPQFKKLLISIIENDGSEIYFKINGIEIISEIRFFHYYQNESNMTSDIIIIDIQTFNIFCELVSTIGMFFTDGGERLLSSI